MTLDLCALCAWLILVWAFEPQFYPHSLRERVRVRGIVCIANAMLILMWASAPTLRVHFFCLPEKKRTKEKGTRMTCPANTAGCPVLLAHSGALLNSHDRFAPRAQTKSAYFRYGLRCSAASYGTESQKQKTAQILSVPEY